MNKKISEYLSDLNTPKDNGGVKYIVNEILDAKRQKSPGYFDVFILAGFKKLKTKLILKLSNGEEFAGYIVDVNISNIIVSDTLIEGQGIEVFYLAINHIVSISLDDTEEKEKEIKRKIGFQTPYIEYE